MRIHQKKLQQRFFTKNFTKFFRTPHLSNTYWRVQQFSQIITFPQQNWVFLLEICENF